VHGAWRWPGGDGEMYPATSTQTGLAQDRSCSGWSELNRFVPQVFFTPNGSSQERSRSGE
jgi:hypothetical protein